MGGRFDINSMPIKVPLTNDQSKQSSVGIGFVDRTANNSVGLSAMPMSEKSLREKAGQISDRRFDPMLFDANCQTDRELMENYFRKEAVDSEVMTARDLKQPKLRSIII